MVKCVVSGCPNRVGSDARGFTRPRKRFYKFPKDPVRVKVWLAALRETDKQDPTEQHLICEDHFLPEDITKNGVHSDAIPIMPPCLEGAWGAESEEEEEEERCSTAEEENDDDDGGGGGGGGGSGKAGELPVTEPPQQQLQQLQEAAEETIKTEEATEETTEETTEEATEETTAEPPRFGGSALFSQPSPSPQPRDAAAPCVSDDQTSGLHAGPDRSDPGSASRPSSISEQTLCVLEKLLAAPGGRLDVRTLERHLVDVISIMEGLCLIQRKTAGHVQWIGRCELSTLLTRSRQSREMERMRLVEETLDGLIKLCARQLFDTTDHPDNAALAYVTHADVSRLPGLQDQTLMVVRAPEETRLEIPPPTEESIKVHLKGGKGPITVVACEVGGAEGGAGGGACFVSLEESRVRAAPLQQPATC